MKDLIKKTFYFSLGLALLTKEKAESLVKELVRKGELKREESKGFLSELLEKARKEKNELITIVQKEIKKVIGEMGLATKEDIEKLERKIKGLEKKAK